MTDHKLIDTIEALMREAAAEFILPRFQALEAHEIDTKSSPTDLVTVADREAEEWLTPRLAALLPGASVVGEEASAADRSVPQRLNGEGPVFVIDPVDGTANFVEGLPQFGLMVAMVENQQTQIGMIYAPVEGVMLRAVRGQGLEIDGAPFTRRKGRPFAQATGDYSSKYVKPPLREKLTNAVTSCASTRQGHCSAYAYLDLARGEIDFVLQYLMSPWDHAAGQLIVEEAGGAFRFLDDGSPYTPVPRSPRAMLAVGDRDDWAAYAEAIS